MCYVNRGSAGGDELKAPLTGGEAEDTSTPWAAMFTSAPVCLSLDLSLLCLDFSLSSLDLPLPFLDLPLPFLDLSLPFY